MFVLGAYYIMDRSSIQPWIVPRNCRGASQPLFSAPVISTILSDRIRVGSAVISVQDSLQEISQIVHRYYCSLP